MKYEIIYSKRKTLCLQIKRDGSVVVRAPYRTSSGLIEDFVSKHKEWIIKKQNAIKNATSRVDSLSESDIDALKMSALEIIPDKVKYYASVVGVEYAGISINKAKTRFGSCSSKGRLNFSCFLMQYPMEAIDYVVLHEVAHLKELNHSKKFWAIVEKHMPDYKERRLLLKTR